MKPALPALLLLTFVLSAFHPDALAAESTPPVQMGQMHLVLLSRPADAKPTDATPAQLADHRRAVAQQLQSGAVALACDVTTNTPLSQVLVLREADTNAARSVVASLLAVKNGAWRAETLAWYGPTNVFQRPASDARGTPFVFGLLLRGTNAAKLPADEVAQIQAGHMANIRRLAEAGKLAVAGPFMDGGDRRGVFVFKVASLAEAQQLADTDPAVIAGRLRIELWPVEIPAGILP